MSLSIEQIEKIQTLLASENYADIQQGTALVEALCHTEAEFRNILNHLGRRSLSTDVDLDVLHELFQAYSQKNYLSVWALGILAKWSRFVQTTTELILIENALTCLPESIENLTALTSLELFYNQFTCLPDFIGNLTNLTSLDLSYNQLSCLPDSIEHLSNLTNLNLDCNQLTSTPETI